jgi:hypothetical protein
MVFEPLSPTDDLLWFHEVVGTARGYGLKEHPFAMPFDHGYYEIWVQIVEQRIEQYFKYLLTRLFTGLNTST